MKKFLIALSLSSALLGAAPAFAEEASAPAPAPVAVTAEAVAAPETAAPAPAAAEAAPAAEAAAAPAPTANKADDGFLMMSAAFVILMSIPGLALFNRKSVV